MAPFTAKSTGGVATAPKRAVLAAIASCCCGMLTRASTRRQSVAAEKTAQEGESCPVGSVTWLLEVMVACIVFYDRASAGGSAFTSREVPIKKCIWCIKKYGGGARGKLLSSIRYSTFHFSSAPPSIQSSVEDE